MALRAVSHQVLGMEIGLSILSAVTQSNEESINCFELGRNNMHTYKTVGIWPVILYMWIGWERFGANFRRKSTGNA